MKAILFDLDETLLDRTVSLRKFVSWQAYGMLRQELRGNEPSFVERFIQIDANGSVWKDIVYKQLIEEFNIQNWSWAELLQSYELCFCAFAVEKEGVSRALETLKQDGHKLGLISNGRTPFQERNFRALDISDLFEAVTISEAVGMRKPDPEIFLMTCNQLGVAPSEAIFVGDNPVADIAGASGVGMFTVYVPGYYGESCERADVVCNYFQDLPQIVNSAC